VDYGHTTNNVGAKGDASQNCGLTVPIIQVTDIEIAGPSASGNITWTSDEKIDLKQPIKRFELTLSLFNERQYIIDNAATVPLGIVQIKPIENGVLLRPNPITDF